MARREPCVHSINSLKYITCKKELILVYVIERERERERGKKGNLSSVISRGFTGRNSASRELKLLYATRATRGYWNHKISLRSNVKVFTKKEKNMVYWENHAN